MPQANTAQREPSMEEILASIRRIIEDGDAAAQRDDSDAPDPFTLVDFNAVLDDDDPEPEIDAFRDEFAADFASMDLEPSSREPSIRMSEAATLMDEVQAISTTPPVVPKAAEPAESFRRAASPFDAVNGNNRPAPEPVQAVAAEPAEASAASSDTAADVAADRRSSLISDRPSRQVAAAFDELSEAFAATRRRSFDEMAEEMMRPMLQDWLDNNLPLLVERLVREEIELIARGGSR